MLWDGTQKHFGLRISRGGAKSFIILLGSGRRKTVGRFPTITLAQARSLAKQLLAEHALGKYRAKPIAWADAVQLYLAACEVKNRASTVKSYTRLLNVHFDFGRQQLADITRHDIARKIDKLQQVPAEQNHAIVMCKTFFRWAVRQAYLDANPCDGFTTTKRPSRDRLLSDDEARAILRLALEGDDAFSFIVALLIATGQRRGEISALQRAWNDEKEHTITLPSSLCKNKRTHCFPYGEMTAGILKHIPVDDGPYLFPASRMREKTTTTFNGWSKAKEVFDKRLASAGYKVAPYTLHDFRRFLASRMAAEGVSLPTIERYLNHVSGSFGGIVSVYQRHDWMPEMRQAVDKYEAYLSRLLAQAVAPGKAAA